MSALCLQKLKHGALMEKRVCRQLSDPLWALGPSKCHLNPSLTKKSKLYVTYSIGWSVTRFGSHSEGQSWKLIASRGATAKAFPEGKSRAIR
jgi:hypothetical protein